jgi:hypothetical protein
MFFVVLAITFVVVLRAAVLGGPRAAACVGLATIMIAPTWMYREFGAIRLDVRTAVALAVVAAIGLHPQTTWRIRFIFADFVALALVVAQCVSEDLTNPATTAPVFVDLGLQWLLPYAVGRLAWRSMDDARSLIGPMAVACVVLSVWAAVESIVRFNPLGTLVGHAGSLQGMGDLRWGLRRAEGPVTHPIFFGLQLVLMLPFALAAARRAKRGDGPDWWRYVPWITAAGVVFTMSRGPQLGVAVVLLTTIVLVQPHRRALVLIPTVAGLLFMASAGSWVVDFLHRWSGEETRMTVLIRGEPYAYTGTTHRLLQLRVYEEAVAHAGWFGYGSIGLRAGETKIPYVEDHLRQMFSSIDNHYLQFVLQSGFVGLSLFVLLCLTGVGYAARATFAAANPAPLLSAAAAGGLSALVLLMASVWLASDFRMVLLLVVGLAGGMQASRTAGAPAADSKPTLARAALNLSPGHRIAPSM